MYDVIVIGHSGSVEFERHCLIKAKNPDEACVLATKITCSDIAAMNGVVDAAKMEDFVLLLNIRVVRVKKIEESSRIDFVFTLITTCTALGFMLATGFCWYFDNYVAMAYMGTLSLVWALTRLHHERKNKNHIRSKV